MTFMAEMNLHTDGWVLSAHHGCLIQNNFEAIGAMFPDTGWSMSIQSLK